MGKPDSSYHGGNPASSSEQALLDHIAELNHADMNVRVFTYAFGNSIESQTLHKIACAHQGIWYQVRDDGDLASTMAAYFQYFAAAAEVDHVLGEGQGDRGGHHRVPARAGPLRLAAQAR